MCTGLAKIVTNGHQLWFLLNQSFVILIVFRDILRQCASFCKLAHLARCTPPTPVLELLASFDNDVLHCLEQCTELQLSPMASWQAQISLCHGGFLRPAFLSQGLFHPPPNSPTYRLPLQCLTSRSPKKKLWQLIQSSFHHPGSIYYRRKSKSLLSVVSYTMQTTATKARLLAESVPQAHA